MKAFYSFKNFKKNFIKRLDNESQSNLRKDIRQIGKINNLFVSAYKCRNIYKVVKASYERMIQ